MKKLLLLIPVLIASHVDAQWSVLSQIQGGVKMNALSVVNQNVMWVACDTGRVFKSTNGGINWVQRSSGLSSANIQCISAMDTSNAWIGDVNGSIYRTSDGGASWVQQFALSNSFADGIKMFTLNYGIYYGDPIGSGQPFQLRYTTNGGTNWILTPNAPSNTSEYGVELAWDWLDTGTVWLGTANAVSGASSARVLKTIVGFGGGVWTSSLLNGTGTSQGLYYQSVAFTDANNGIAGSNNSNIRKTTNGGTTWSVVSNPPGLTSFYSDHFFGLKDGSGLIFVSLRSTSPGTTCFRTTNLGLNWTQENLPPLGVTNGMNQMQFLSPNLGYGVGMAGVVLRYGTPSGISLNNNEVPSGYQLGQNYPNPFNPSTKINFSIPSPQNVTLKLYDARGKEVGELFNEFRNAGNYAYEFNGSGYASGIYYYTLTAGNFIQTKKLTLIK